jgi:hypothetical protein
MKRLAVWMAALTVFLVASALAAVMPDKPKEVSGSAKGTIKEPATGTTKMEGTQAAPGKNAGGQIEKTITPTKVTGPKKMKVMPPTKVTGLEENKKTIDPVKIGK